MDQKEINALLQALQRQRDEAMNRLAQEEAKNSVLRDTCEAQRLEIETLKSADEEEPE